MSLEASDWADAAGAGTDRRTFIKQASLAAAGLSASGLLAACGSTAPSGGSSTAASLGPGGLPLARPYRPVTLPIYADNKPIASGLVPEKGPLQFYNWIAYINPTVVKSFEKKYGVKVQISTFTTIDEAVAKLSSGQVQFDVFVPELVFLERLAVGKLLQPLNLSYIPNLQANVWPSLHEPVVRRRQPLHGPLHDLHDGHRLADRQAPRVRSGEALEPVVARCGWRARRSRARSGCSTTSTRA